MSTLELVVIFCCFAVRYSRRKCCAFTPFGMKIDALSWNETGIRYGYNGTHEQDLEVNAEGNYLSFGDFGYDTRTAMRQNIDPMFAAYPHLSGYATFNNNPIYFSDPSGWEGEGPEIPENQTSTGAEISPSKISEPNIIGGDGTKENPFLTRDAVISAEMTLGERLNRQRQSLEFQTQDLSFKMQLSFNNDNINLNPTSMGSVSSYDIVANNTQNESKTEESFIDSELWKSTKTRIDRVGTIADIIGSSLNNEKYFFNFNQNKFEFHSDYSNLKGPKHQIKKIFEARDKALNIFEKKGLNLFKLSGKLLGGFSTALSAAELLERNTLGRRLELAINLGSFLPGYGWAIGGSYMMLDLGSEYFYNKSIQELIDNE